MDNKWSNFINRIKRRYFVHLLRNILKKIYVCFILRVLFSKTGKISYTVQNRYILYSISELIQFCPFTGRNLWHATIDELIKSVAHQTDLYFASGQNFCNGIFNIAL